MEESLQVLTDWGYQPPYPTCSSHQFTTPPPPSLAPFLRYAYMDTIFEEFDCAISSANRLILKLHNSRKKTIILDTDQLFLPDFFFFLRELLSSNINSRMNVTYLVNQDVFSCQSLCLVICPCKWPRVILKMICMRKYEFRRFCFKLLKNIFGRGGYHL